MNGIVPEVIVVGSSAGAIETLADFLPNLAANYPLPIIVVIHLPSDKPSLLTDIFQAKCAVAVCEAEDKASLQAGTVYFAPPDYHVLLERDGTLSLSSDEEVLYSRPSIDVLFESAADAYGPKALGIILTGANSDGAKGLKAIIDAGGTGLVQDPATAYSPAMPNAALKASPNAQKMSLDQMITTLNTYR